MTHYALLKEREVIDVTGPDSRAFLQGKISNNMDNLNPEQSMYAAMLTPQGKYLYDFIVIDKNPAIWMDTEKARCDALTQRLNLFRLNSDVQIYPQGSSLTVVAIWGAEALSCVGLKDKAGLTSAFGSGLALTDPRHSSLGSRLIAPTTDINSLTSSLGIEKASSAAYDAHRLHLGIPDGSRDLVVDKSFLLESNFEDLNGVAFDKGCYIGQENTARQKHRGTIRKRLVKVRIDGPTPDPNTPVTWRNDEIGTMRSSRDDQGIAMIRLDRWEKANEEGATLYAGSAVVVPIKPDWAEF